MQALWETKIDWDDPLLEKVLNKWKDFQRNLSEVNTIRVPRMVVNPETRPRLLMALVFMFSR